MNLCDVLAHGLCSVKPMEVRVIISAYIQTALFCNYVQEVMSRQFV
jgi:hypothetical protein